jgi:tRNA(His) 5'-end guanylyltransferase
MTADDRIAGLTAAYKADHAVYEQHRGLRAEGRGPVCLRLDGRSFHTFTRGFERPFDARFEEAMDAACRALLAADLGIELAYVQSDEITILIPQDRVPYDGRLEKLVSVPASLCASAFALALSAAGTELPGPPAFDARVLTLDSEDDALAALAERQLDALKNAVSMLVHWTLVLGEGLTPRQAHDRLMPLNMRERIALSESLGAPFAEVDRARKLGRVHTFELVERTGRNPLSGEDVAFVRRVPVCLDPTPEFRTLERLPWAPTR